MTVLVSVCFWDVVASIVAPGVVFDAVCNLEKVVCSCLT